MKNYPKSMIVMPQLPVEDEVLFVYPGRPIAYRYAVERLAQQFRVECRFDFAPYYAKRPPEGEVALIKAPPEVGDRLETGAQYCAAVGVDRELGYLAISWMYVHPNARGRNIVGKHLGVLKQRWGNGIKAQGPFTKAGYAVASKHGLVDHTRRVELLLGVSGVKVMP